MKHTWSWLLVLGVAGGCAGTKDRPEPPALPADASEPAVEVVPLQYASAVEVVAFLRELSDASRRAVRHRGCALPQRGKEVEMYRDDGLTLSLEPRVEADPRTNSVVVSSSDPTTLSRILEMIARLDQDGLAKH